MAEQTIRKNKLKLNYGYTSEIEVRVIISDVPKLVATFNNGVGAKKYES